MAEPLPPKDAPPTPENVAALHAGLTAAMAGQPGVTRPCGFYTLVDSYLGPWGPTGYPLGYGLRYCHLFNSNARLMANPTTRRWVDDVTVLLQEELRGFIEARFRARTLGSLTEPELRRFAFDSHSRAYSRGGLVMVMLYAPEMIPLILAIPRDEYNPFDPDFFPTIKEMLDTVEESLPLLGETLAIRDRLALATRLARIHARLDRGLIGYLTLEQRLLRLIGQDLHLRREVGPLLDALRCATQGVARDRERIGPDQRGLRRRLKRRLDAILPGWWGWLDPSIDQG